MKCSIEGCPGEYEERKIVHTVRYQGQVIVIDHVPAEVCTICGDVLLKPETVRGIETLLRTGKRSGARHFHRLLEGYSASKPGEIAHSLGYSQVPGTLTDRPYHPPERLREQQPVL
jgi:YgiT-type zinc finger domain-containing protein